MNLTIQGYQFDVPPAGLQPGTPLTEEQVHVLEQTRFENIRNNMAAKIKKLLNGAAELTIEQQSTVAADVQKYASEYQFGQRARGAGGPRVVDPVEREVIRLAKEDISAAYFVKYGERLGKEQLAEVVEKLLGLKRDDYVARARKNIRDKERAGADVLANLV